MVGDAEPVMSADELARRTIVEIIDSPVGKRIVLEEFGKMPSEEPDEIHKFSHRVTQRVLAIAAKRMVGRRVMR